MFLKNGIEIGKIFGITIRLDYSWFIIFLLFTQSFASQYSQITPQFDMVTSIILGAVASILVFTSVLAHELTHSVIANKLGEKVKRITLFIFGGVAEISGEPKSASLEFKMAVAGPLMSIFLGLIAWVLLILAQNLALPLQVQVILESLRYFNLGVGFFNLIPGFPLDGGRILRSILWWKSHDLHSATDIASGVGRVVASGFIILGLIYFILGDTLSGVWLVFIGFFLNTATGISKVETELRLGLSNVKVSNLMTRQVETLESDLSLSDFLEKYFLRRKLSGYPVLKNNELVGMLYTESIGKKRPLSKNTKISQIMTRIAKNEIVNPVSSAYRALTIMARNRFPSLPVEENGRLVGIISQTDLNYYLLVKNAVNG